MPTFSGEALARWSGGEWKPSPPPRAADGISTDTRSLLPGNLYVALEGENFDGHDFVKEAFNKGAVGLLSGEAASPVLTRLAANSMSGIRWLPSGILPRDTERTLLRRSSRSQAVWVNQQSRK